MKSKWALIGERNALKRSLQHEDPALTPILKRKNGNI